MNALSREKEEQESRNEDQRMNAPNGRNEEAKRKVFVEWSEM
jgi:hypothetical protein